MKIFPFKYTSPHCAYRAERFHGGIHANMPIQSIQQTVQVTSRLFPKKGMNHVEFNNSLMKIATRQTFSRQKPISVKSKIMSQKLS